MISGRGFLVGLTQWVNATLSGAVAAGDTVTYTGPGAPYGNVTDGAKINGLFKDQDWTTALSSGSPVFKLGELNDLRRWACASKKVLT